MGKPDDNAADNAAAKLATDLAPEACFVGGARFEFADADPPEPGDPHPVRIKARSRGPAEHWCYYGERVYHDFDGMTPAKDRMPIDFAHGEAIGYFDANEVTGFGLELSGALVPDGRDADPARSLIARAKGGVPYEASIYTGRDLVVELVEGDATSEVNGQSVEGPCTIVRQWSLRGVAVCPFGSDGDTETAFKRSVGGKPVVTLHPQSTAMATTNDQPADEPATDTTAAATAAATGATPPAEPTADPAEAPAASAATPAEAATDEPSPQDPGDKFALAQRFDQFVPADQAMKFAAEGASLETVFAAALKGRDERIAKQDQTIGELTQRLGGHEAAEAEGLGEPEAAGRFAAAGGKGGGRKSFIRFAGDPR